MLHQIQQKKKMIYSFRRQKMKNTDIFIHEKVIKKIASLLQWKALKVNKKENS